MKKGTGGNLTPAQRKRRLDWWVDHIKSIESYDAAKKAALIRKARWNYVDSRPEQVWPDDPDVDVLVLQGGRGSGKTRSGAEILYDWANEYEDTRWAAVAPTFGACRAVCFEGESGLLNVIPEQLMWGGSKERAYNSSRLELKLANSSRITGYSSEKPGNLRGPQHHGWWMDEPAEFRDAHKLPMAVDTTFSNLVLGARLRAEGLDKVRGLVTGTPKPCGLLSGGVDDNGDPIPGLLTGFMDLQVQINKMSSRDNLSNLSKIYRNLVKNLEGTRIGMQEIDAELLTDIQGALWHSHWIVEDEHGLDPDHEWWSVVVGIDPAGSTRGRADSTGIVVCGLDHDGVYWVLEDLSGKYSPGEWAGVAWDAVQRWNAGNIVVERNYGGDMVEDTLIRHTECPASMVRQVSATRGKLLRAEPVALIYEPTEDHPPGSRVKHASRMPQLVDQLVTYSQGSTFSPDRLDAMVWAMTFLSRFESSGVGAFDISGIFGERGSWY